MTVDFKLSYSGLCQYNNQSHKLSQNMCDKCISHVKFNNNNKFKRKQDIFRSKKIILI